MWEPLLGPSGGEESNVKRGRPIRISKDVTVLAAL
jgi:hypothetical protein